MPCGDSYRIIIPLDMESYKKLNLIYDNNVKFKDFLLDDMNLLRNVQFIEKVDKELNVLLDEDESEIFDYTKTLEFIKWLTKQINSLNNCRLKEIYQEMLELANLAIDLKTGIGFDL